MTKATPILVVAAAAAGLFATSAMAQEGGKPLTTALSGPAEKPNPGDPNGKGTASLKVDAGKNQICYELSASDIAPATMAHIHKAAVDAAGPVVVPLTPPGADGKSKACVNADKAVVEDILKNPAAYYVNVHNAEFPAGAIRGQLGK